LCSLRGSLHKNLIIILFIILTLLIIGFVVGSLRSLKTLLSEKESGFSGSLTSAPKKEVLPYSSISLDTFLSDYLCVDIQAKIVLGETIDPSVDIFLERVQIGDPFCPKCNTPLDIKRASWMADGVQTGYLCKKCNTEDNRDYFELLRDVKGFVRSNFSSMWALYTKKIADLTGNRQDKYCLPS